MRYSLLALLTLSVTMLLSGRVLTEEQPEPGGPKVGRIPPPGKKIPDDERKELRDGADKLIDEINNLSEALKGKPALLELLPDVEIFYNAVHYALTYDELYSNVGNARKMLK